MRLFLLLILILPNLSIQHHERRSEVSFIQDYLKARYPDHQFDRFILVKVKKQRLQLIDSGKEIAHYDISTAAKGIGNLQGSEKTPIGLLNVAFKLGDDVPIGGILRGRSYTGKIAPIHTDRTRSNDDLVLTRAIRLSGMESGFNKDDDVDTYSRYIYIHGTPEEGMIGTPVSHGCIRMRNHDIVSLYEHLQEDDYVVILNL